MSEIQAKDENIKDVPLSTSSKTLKKNTKMSIMEQMVHKRSQKTTHANNIHHQFIPSLESHQVRELREKKQHRPNKIPSLAPSSTSEGQQQSRSTTEIAGTSI